MTEIWVAGAVVAAGVGFVLGRRAVRKPQPVIEAMTDREVQLAKRVAIHARCSVADALPAVRHELALAPNQTDDTLAKRATYHYQMNLPEQTCTTYRDSGKG